MASTVPPAGYMMLRCVDSGLLLADDGKGLTLTSRGDDRAMWVSGCQQGNDDVFLSGELTNTGGTNEKTVEDPLGSTSSCRGSVAVFQHAVTSRSVCLEDTGDDGSRRVLQLRGSGPAPNFQLEVGPVLLPSVHLLQLRESGITVLRAASAEAVAAMRTIITGRMADVEAARRAACVPIATGSMEHAPPHEFQLEEELLPFDPPIGATQWLLQSSPLFAQLNAHPVQLWLLEQFMGSGAIAAHTALPRINMPRKFWTREETGGWHCDTPYGWNEFKEHVERTGGRFPEPVARPLGVQCNICLDDYTPENGATLVVRGSCHNGTRPPAHLNAFHDETTNHAPPEASWATAPSGSVIMYHAATWHRLSVNQSTRPRIGLLQSFVPDVVAEQPSDPGRRSLISSMEALPGRVMSPAAFAQFKGTRVCAMLSDRERRDLQNLWKGYTLQGVERPSSARL
jgi:hypothetical protein